MSLHVTASTGYEHALMECAAAHGEISSAVENLHFHLENVPGNPCSRLEASLRLRAVAITMNGQTPDQEQVGSLSLDSMHNSGTAGV